MKLLTHNMLTSCMLKGVQKGFPLRIMATDVKVVEVEFNPEFIRKVIPKMEWAAVCEAAETLGERGDLSAELPPGYEEDEVFLKQAHHVLMEIEVKEGALVCPETGRQFPITNGIPNMLS